MENKNNEEKGCCSKNDGKSKGLKHGLMMMGCCLVPLLIIAILPLIGLKGWSLGSLAILICPLLHVGMMVFMMKSKKGHSCHGSNNEASSAEAGE